MRPAGSVASSSTTARAPAATVTAGDRTRAAANPARVSTTAVVISASRTLAGPVHVEGERVRQLGPVGGHQPRPAGAGEGGEQAAAQLGDQVGREVAEEQVTVAAQQRPAGHDGDQQAQHRRERDGHAGQLQQPPGPGRRTVGTRPTPASPASWSSGTRSSSPTPSSTVMAASTTIAQTSRQRPKPASTRR